MRRNAQWPAQHPPQKHSTLWGGFQIGGPHLRKTALYLQKWPNASFPPQTESQHSLKRNVCLLTDPLLQADRQPSEEKFWVVRSPPQRETQESMRRNVWWSVLQLREREERRGRRREKKGERKRQIDRVLLWRLCQMPRSPSPTWCQSSMRRNALGLILLFLTQEWSTMRRNAKCWTFISERETVFCEDIRLSVTLLLRQRHLSVKRNAEWPAPSFRQGTNPLWGKMPETWTSSSNTEASLYQEKSQEFGPPFLTERQSSVRRDAGSLVLLRQRNSTVCREMLIIKREKQRSRRRNAVASDLLFSQSQHPVRKHLGWPADFLKERNRAVWGKCWMSSPWAKTEDQHSMGETAEGKHIFFFFKRQYSVNEDKCWMAGLFQAGEKALWGEMQDVYFSFSDWEIALSKDKCWGVDPL